MKEQNILVHGVANTWQEAVQLAGSLLESAGSVSSQYTKEMIAAVEAFGPYMVILPGFALAHAAPSESVFRNDMSLVTLRSPVCFGSANDPVWVVLCICCTDRAAHLESLRQIAELLLEEGAVDRLAGAGSAGEIASMLNARL